MPIKSRRSEVEVGKEISNPQENSAIAVLRNSEQASSQTFNSLQSQSTSTTTMKATFINPLYTAINGRDFLGGLAQREQRNPQFDFLKPTHMLFSYFTSLTIDFSENDLSYNNQNTVLAPAYTPFNLPPVSKPISSYNKLIDKSLLDPISLPSVGPVDSGNDDMDVDMDVDQDQDDDIETKVVSSYVPRTLQSIRSDSLMMLVDPVSGKAIPASSTT
eukprot:gene22080-28583_t